MADVEFSHNMGAYGRSHAQQGSDQSTPNALAFMTNVAGAVVSLALIAGVGVWGYKLLVRDVSGVPVVRAAEGEMRVRPEDPGGQLARHQGLAVNAIAADGVAAGPVDSVTLAPRDVDLAAEDQPITRQAVAPVEPPAPLPPASDAIEATPSGAGETADIKTLLQQGAIDDVVAELTAGVAPLVDVTGAKTVKVEPSPQTEVAEAETPAPAAAEVKPTPAVLDAPGVRTSIRPKLRPAELKSLVKPASFTPAAATQEVDPAKIPSGTRLAQLGAFDSADVARGEWTRLKGRFGDYLQGKSRVIEQAQSGGRTFYRLRAMGFVDLSDARRFCSAFKAEGVDCIPVRSK